MPDPTLANWRAPEHARWTFRHVRELLPTAAIDHDPDDVAPLLPAPRSLDDFALPLGEGRSMGMAAFLERTATDAMVVLHDGRLVFAHDDGREPAHVPHILMSATKSVVGLLVGIVQERFGFDVDAEVTTVLPELAPASPYRGATFRQLLDMRAGVVLDAAAQGRYGAATGWDPAPAGAPREGLRSFFASQQGAPAPHGGPFRYVSANTDLLGLAIERHTGRRFAPLVAELLWKRLGAEEPASITLDPETAPRCTGGWCATVRDLARVGQLVLDGGRRGADQIVPAAWLDDIAGGGDAAAWTNGEWGAAFAPIAARMRYRSGWYVVDQAPRMLFAMGIHGQNLFVVPSARLVVAKFSAQASPVDPVSMGLTHRAVAELVRLLA